MISASRSGSRFPFIVSALLISSGAQRERSKTIVRKFSNSKLLRLVTLAAFLLAALCAPMAQSRGTEPIHEIKFAHGKRSATVSGSVQLPHGEGDMHNDGADRYSFHYRAGERLTFSLESEANRAVFSISSMDSALANLPTLKTRWSGRLPASGDYYVTVWTEKGAAPYTLKVFRNFK
jgi:hypothetical protein